MNPKINPMIVAGMRNIPIAKRSGKTASGANIKTGMRAIARMAMKPNAARRLKIAPTSVKVDAVSFEPIFEITPVYSDSYSFHKGMMKSIVENAL